MLKAIRKTIFLAIALFLAGGFLMGNFTRAAEDKGILDTILEGTQPTGDLGSTDFMFDLSAVTHPDIKQQNIIGAGINYIFSRIINIMAVTIASAAALMITVGGFKIMTGDHEQIDKGKSLIFASIKGLLITLGAYIIVTTVQFLIKSIYG